MERGKGVRVLMVGAGREGGVNDVWVWVCDRVCHRVSDHVCLTVCV